MSLVPLDTMLAGMAPMLPLGGCQRQACRVSIGACTIPLPSRPPAPEPFSHAQEHRRRDRGGVQPPGMPRQLLKTTAFGVPAKQLDMQPVAFRIIQTPADTASCDRIPKEPP
jgi:hypothetical protein